MDDDSISLSRRTILAGAGALAASFVIPRELAAAVEDGGGLSSPSALGGWLRDSELPVYRVTAGLPIDTRDASGAAYPLNADPFFLIGNYRITLFTHASGLLKIVTGERGWTRANEPLPGAEQNGASIEVTREGRTQSHELLGLKGVCADSRRSVRQFGCGSVRYELNPDEGIQVVRTLSLAPSDDKDLGVPAFVVNVHIRNRGRSSCGVTYREKVLSRSMLVIDRGTDESRKAVRFANRVEVDEGRSFIASHVTAHSHDPGILSARDQANRYNLFPPSLCLAYPKTVAQNHTSPVVFTSRERAPGATELEATVTARLEPGESRTIAFVVGLSPTSDVGDVVAFADGLGESQDGVHFGGAWRAALATFRTVADPVFQRELTWSTHALLAMATYNSFYGETFIPQGMTYDYQMDLTAAPRDHLQHAMAACYFRPPLAKSTIRYVLSKMTVQGEIKYTDFGFGKTSNSAWNTSDQQLYLFQAVGEYLRITGDFGFLDERTTFLPREAGYEGTVLEKLDRALSYLREEVAMGPHGLVRLMNSDWSDMVFADTSVLTYYWTAESHMNSAMVVAVAPNLLRQLERYERAASGPSAGLVRRIIGSLGIYLEAIEKALYDDLGDRAFSRRLYFNSSRPFGDDDMHVEPQSFLLQAESFPVERKRRLWVEIQSRLLAGERLGPRQRAKPVVGGAIRPYTSENGGIWYSLAGQMVTGLATFDRASALSLLRMMTFDNFARHYPSYWTGLWSAADTVNAVASGDIAGLPRPDNDGLWTTFASYCAHPHAWQIYGWARISES